MLIKRIVTVALLLLALAGIAYVLLGGPGPRRETAAAVPGATPPDTAAAPDLIVYYMDMGKDCTTCESLESYTREALETHFAEALASGRIAWRTADLDLPENAHFIDEYRLYTKSVVLIRQVDGKPSYSDSLSRIWELVYDKDAYTDYIRDCVQRFLDSPRSPE